MIYNSVADIIESMSEARERFQKGIAGLSDAQQNFRSTPETWSVAEIVEHVSIVDSQIVKLVDMLLAKADGAAGEGASNGGHQMKPFSFDAYIERSLTEKYQAPERAHPRGGVSVTDSLDKMRATRETLLALAPRVESTDLSGVRYPHPAFGPLDAYQWLALIGVHEDRHLRQLDTLMQSPEFKSL